MKILIAYCQGNRNTIPSCCFVQVQVENEYGFYESAYGEGGKRYAQWAANMAVSQNTGVPWIMCQQFDPPDTVVRTHNLYQSSP